MDGVKHQLLDDPTFRTIVEQDLRDGQHRNPQVRERPEFFTTAYLYRPADLEREARDAGLFDVRLFAVEGPAWILGNSVDIDSQLVAARATESEPSLIGATPHILVAGHTGAD